MASTTASVHRRSVVVIGKESVGKSTIIAHLTTGSPTISNFRGSTVSCELYPSNEYDFVDTPGIVRRSDTETTHAAIQQLQHGDVVALVVQATHLDQDLADMLPLVSGKRCVIVVTFWDKLHAVRTTDACKLTDIENELKVRVIALDARHITGAQREAISSAVEQAAPPRTTEMSSRAGWLIPPPASLLDQQLAGPILGLFILFFPAIAAVWGANTFAALADPLAQRLIAHISGDFWASPAVVREVLVGPYGLITMGPLLLLWAVPTVLLYSLMLGAYKASGLLDRMSSALHPLVRRLGLSGRDIVRIVMGFGCNVPAVISTRACSSCSRDTTIAAIAFGSACSYQFGATLAVFSAVRRPYLVVPFLAYVAITTIVYTALTSSRKAKSPFNVLVTDGRTFLVWPDPVAIWREASLTLRSFFKTALPIFFAITFLASIFAWTGVLSILANGIRPVMALLGLPGELALPVIMACIRKDGLLLIAQYGQVASLSDTQLLTAVYLSGELLPCLVTVLTILRERSGRFVSFLLLRQAVAAILFTLALAWFGHFCEG